LPALLQPCHSTYTSFCCPKQPASFYLWSLLKSKL
jgi:hypothetical protein